MGRYSLFKERLLQANLSLVSIGTGLAWTFFGDDIAINFAAGGASGLLYQWLLQKGVDGISLSTSPLYKKVAPLHLFPISTHLANATTQSVGHTATDWIRKA